MRRYGYGWAGYNLPQMIGAGGAGVARPAPALFWSTAYSPDNFSLVLANQTSAWKGLEETTGTDLAQGTSGNQPILVEDNTVTQFTASNQPTYTQFNGVDVVQFGDSKFLNDLPLMTGDFTYIFRNLTLSQLRGSILLFGGGGYLQISNTNGQVNLRSDTPSVSHNIFNSYSFTPNQTFDLAVMREGNNVRGYIDGVISPDGDIDVTGQTFTYPELSRNSASNSIDGSLGSLEIYDVAVVDVVNPTETPSSTLTADPTKMRTSANVNPVLGEDIAKWYADEWSGYRDNYVLFDPVKYLEGLSAQAGDFTYIFKYQDDDQATAGAIVSSNIDASGISNVDADTTELIAGDATSYSFDNTGATSYRMVAYLKSGDDVYNVTDYVTSATQDATGKAFNLTSLGKATGGKDMKVKEVGVYGSELTGTDLDYFFYERDVNTGEIILVDGQPQLPTPPLPPTLFPVTSTHTDGLTGYVRLNDEIINNTDEFTIFGYWKSPNYGANTLFMENGSANGGSKINLAYTGTTIRIRVKLSSGINTYYQPTTNLALPVNQWNFVSVTFKTNGNVEFGVNGSYIADDLIPNLLTRNENAIIGPSINAFAYLTSESGRLNASTGFVGLSGHTALTQAELETIRGTDINKAQCIDLYPQAIRDKLTNFFNLGTWDGNLDALVDQIGSNVATNVGGVTQVVDGLNVNCAS